MRLGEVTQEAREERRAKAGTQDSPKFIGWEEEQVWTKDPEKKRPMRQEGIQEKALSQKQGEEPFQGGRNQLCHMTPRLGPDEEWELTFGFGMDFAGDLNKNSYDKVGGGEIWFPWV